MPHCGLLPNLKIAGAREVHALVFARLPLRHLPRPARCAFPCSTSSWFTLRFPPTPETSSACVPTRLQIHLIKPIGFSMDDNMRRAGLDYHGTRKVRMHDNGIHFWRPNPMCGTSCHDHTCQPLGTCHGIRTG